MPNAIVSASAHGSTRVAPAWNADTPTAAPRASNEPVGNSGLGRPPLRLEKRQQFPDPVGQPDPARAAVAAGGLGQPGRAHRGRGPAHPGVGDLQHDST